MHTVIVIISKMDIVRPANIPTTCNMNSSCELDSPGSSDSSVGVGFVINSVRDSGVILGVFVEADVSSKSGVFIEVGGSSDVVTGHSAWRIIIC